LTRLRIMASHLIREASGHLGILSPPIYIPAREFLPRNYFKPYAYTRSLTGQARPAILLASKPVEPLRCPRRQKKET